LSLEQQIQKAVTDAVHAAIGEALKDLKPKGEEVAGLVTTAQAGKLLACSSEYVRSLQDKGLLHLVFLPGSNHRRVLKSEVLELIKKNTMSTNRAKKTVKEHR
jgi:enoyl reductase-like protein